MNGQRRNEGREREGTVTREGGSVLNPLGNSDHDRRGHRHWTLTDF